MTTLDILKPEQYQLAISKLEATYPDFEKYWDKKEGEWSQSPQKAEFESAMDTFRNSTWHKIDALKQALKISQTIHEANQLV